MRWLAECNNALQWGYSLRGDLLKAKNLGYLLLLAAMVTLAVGLLLYLVDPNIRSPLDGVWSAWVTMTHVGFGDVVPVSFLGRLLAAALILFGLVLFSLFTALVSVALIGRNMDAERVLIDAALHVTSGQRQAAAKHLGYGRNTLTRKIRELNLCI